MHFIFCSDPFDARRPDDSYAQEAEVVTELGCKYSLFSYEALVNEGAPQKAARRIAEVEGKDIALYRGWMLTPEKYEKLYDALHDRNLALINTPEQYRHCHYLPESYPVISEYTPRSIWLPIASGLGLERIVEALEPFGSSPVVLKDYVKSQKHDWAEACFIPSTSDRRAVERVVNRFLELQGDDLQGGLVFREFVELEPLATHSRSGMPLTKEYRIFFLDGEPIYWIAYWDEGEYGSAEPPIEQFREIAGKVRSRFFTMDIARRKDGRWIIVELGDAQVAGLPDNANVETFYNAILRHGL